jgi:isochorismate synthase
MSIDALDREFLILVGANLKLVVRRVGRSMVSNPMTGSAPRSADPDEDRNRARTLSTSDKDLREHHIVVDAAVDVSRPYYSGLKVSGRPSVIRIRTMWHLSPQVHGVLAALMPNALEPAAAVPPTPVVCGRPTREAGRIIARPGSFDRRHYGWMNDGDRGMGAGSAMRRDRTQSGCGSTPAPAWSRNRSRMPNSPRRPRNSRRSCPSSA